MFVLACHYTYQVAQAGAVILVLAVLATHHHARVDRVRYAELFALAEKEPIREPMALRPGTDRTRLSQLLAEADQERSTTRH